jgi:hypothetical protein
MPELRCLDRDDPEVKDILIAEKADPLRPPAELLLLGQVGDSRLSRT